MIDLSDVRRLEQETRTLREMDYRHGEDLIRSRILSLVLLATDHLIEGDVEIGVGAGLRAPESAGGGVGSARTRDRFRPLAAQARRHGTHTGAFDLAEQINAGAP
ncbi:hypothetical protein [Lentzea kentuckyensis]|uniref:hypothetical protein n=1 Tax=Lentzea kentuckyensis TaxID=360086 RepID=UPI000A360D6A|nr:hypothetical protein [Lentzea kentuckyensis]